MTKRALRRWVARGAVLAVAAATLVPAGLVQASHATAASGTVVNIDPATRYQTIQGWGTSLAWWAEGTGGWSSTSAKNALAKALFSPTSGLGLNVVRYNIGATTPDDTCAAQMRTGGAVPSFEQSAGDYDWSQDPNQRYMLQEAKSLGANVFEAIAYSAPAWMTENDCSAGANTAGQDNLSSSEYNAYAQYLATVVAHFRNSFGIPISTVEPFNEPVQSKWGLTGTATEQQAMDVDQTAQNTIIADLKSQLSSAGVGQDVGIAAPDELTPQGAVNDYDSYSAASKADVSQLNSHEYESSQNGDPLYELGQQTGKPVTMSEWGTGAQSTPIAAALTLSHQILTNEQQIHPSTWSIWQAANGPEDGNNINDLWGLVWTDISSSGNGQLTFPKRYYAMGNYSKFVRPGYQMIANDDANTFTAYNPSNDQLVIVATNPNSSSESMDYDLSHFSVASGTSAAGYQTDSTENLASLPATSVSGSLSVTLPAQSVTTYVIPHVTSAGQAAAPVAPYGSQVEAYGTTTGGTVYDDVYTPGSSWSGWSSLGGDLADDPTAVTYGSQEQVFGRTSSGATESAVYTPGSGWSTWQNIGGNIAGDPVPIDYDTQQSGNQMQVYGRASDGSVWSDVYSPSSNKWSGWNSIGGDLAGNPAVIQYGNQVQVYGRESSGAVGYDVYTPGSGWSGWKSLGGTIATDPTVVQYGSQLEVYARTSGGTVYSDAYTPGSGWGAWYSLGGDITGHVAATEYYTAAYGDQMELFGRGTDGAIWSDVYTPSSGHWSGWYSINGNVTGDPTAFQYGNKMEVFTRAGNGATYSDISTPGSGWSGWTSMGGNLKP